MQRVKLIDRGNKNLAVFVLGWGAAPAVVGHIAPPGTDVWAVYDYRTVEPLPQEELSKYDKVWLFAWSFGVWAAERIFKGVRCHRAVALCGSPFPVNDKYGIPERAFGVTLKAIAAGGDEKFNRRAYGEYYNNPAGVGREAGLWSEDAGRGRAELGYGPRGELGRGGATEAGQVAGAIAERPWQERMEELEALYRESSVIYTPTLNWTDAVIATRDVIFPTQNLRNYWGEKAVLLDAPHYPFGNEKLICDFISNDLLNDISIRG